jgi:thiamine-phosphate pyrophosphorylase
MQNTTIDKRLKGLYLITDETLTPYDKIEEKLIPAFENGCKILQLRDKTSNPELLLQTALTIKTLCDKYNVTYIINDNIDLAKEVDADGVHIGRDDEELSLARRLLGKDKIIGVSCYGDVMLAKEMEHRGADYVAFGAFFNSSTKPNAKTINLGVMEEAKRLCRVPVCAIGGITTQNAGELIERKTDMLAVITDVWSHDIAQKSKQYESLFTL